MEIDTWVGASGKNGMRRDWLIRSQANGIVFARATRPVGNRLDFLGFPGTGCVTTNIADKKKNLEKNTALG